MTTEAVVQREAGTIRLGTAPMISSLLDMKDSIDMAEMAAVADPMTIVAVVEEGTNVVASAVEEVVAVGPMVAVVEDSVAVATVEVAIRKSPPRGEITLGVLV
jgi:hypothetical protein